MNESLFKADTKVFGQNLCVFDEIDSTNKKALSDMEDRFIPNGTCYIALRQTKGMGSYGKTYEANTKLGLWLSVIVHEPYMKNPLTFVPAVAAAMFLKDCKVHAHLKWPNDVLVNDKKISGILCQAKTMQGGTNACVVGIGININQSENDFSSEVSNIATSVKIITGDEYKIEEVFKKFIKYFEDVYCGETPVVRLWEEHSLMIGRVIRGQKDGKDFSAKVSGITKEGHLLIETENGTEELLSHGAVDIYRDYCYHK